ncbi:hypothetical protein [Tardiphaga robiniae]|uniref:Uncharacterized protein n=1 Tax=Tardiphaga robiniae TaxID=943830 RepID=A0A7G6TVH3_9BRAD|nr:hypothetical protein [Tardiphaga robiniae]QND70755.1 hypothetical protein HB776_05540 [Tardiphaga robiniae]
MAQIAEAYIHFRPYSSGGRKAELLGKYAEKIAVQVASEIYGGDVLVHIEMEEGSLKTRMAVATIAALAIYGHVADYKGFKESIGEMCADAREFAVDVCGPFSRKAGVELGDIYRFERRLKTPGKLYRIASSLEKLERSVDELSPKAVQKELARLRGELDAAASDLTPRDIENVEKLLNRPKLPSPQKWPKPEPAKILVRREEDMELPFAMRDVRERALPSNRIVFQSTTQVPRQGRIRLRPPKADQSFLDD